MAEMQFLEGGNIAAANAQSDTTLGMGAGGWSAAGTVVQTGIQVWSAYSQARIQRSMQADLAKYNNQMRAIVQGVKQFAADKNRASLGDSFVDQQIQIDIDRMRAEASTQVQAAFTGASHNARRATMQGIDRNAAQARFMNESRFTGALQQIQLQEYSDTMGSIQAFQNTTPTGMPSLGADIGTAVLGLADKSIKSGAFDKGAPIRNYFSDLFNNKETRLPTD